MSCPYLERGTIFLCHALSKRGMEVKPDWAEADCFSGDFSQCSLLLFQAIQERRALRLTLSSKKVFAKEGGPNGWRECLPAV